MTKMHRLVAICAVLLGHLTLGLPTEAQTDQRSPAYPIVVRISPEVLKSILPKEIEHSGPVNSVIMGTRAVGQNHTKGKVYLQVLTNSERDEDAVAAIRFEGITHSTSVGNAGAVIIDSHSDTSFICTRQIRFDPERGFVADPTQVSARTNLVYDGFRSVRGGLGSRMVSRIAQRRADESREEASRAIERDQRVELVKAFEENLDPKLTSLNRMIALARSVALLWGRSPRLQLAATTSPNGLHIGLGKAKKFGVLTGDHLASTDAPVEIWIHSSLLGGPFSSALSFPKPEHLLLRAEQRPAWTALRSIVRNLKSREPSPAPVSAWVRIGLGNSSEQPALARDRPDSYVYVTNRLAPDERTDSKPENGITAAVETLAEFLPSSVDLEIFDLTSPLLQQSQPDLLRRGEFKRGDE